MSTTGTTSRRATATPTSAILRFARDGIDRDTQAPTPSANVENPSSAIISGARATATCSKDNDCAGLIEATPLGSGGSTHLTPGAAIGIALGVVGLIVLSLGCCFWFWRRRNMRSTDKWLEGSPSNRDRSASNATDQKTLVASLRHSRLHGQQADMVPTAFAKVLTGPRLIQTSREKLVHERQESSSSAVERRAIHTEKMLPMAPTDMPLPPEPVEEKRHAVNVNSNRSIISDDIMRSTATSTHTTVNSRNKMPKYRFEEYVPPVATTHRLPLSHTTKSSKRTSEIEMGPYPRNGPTETGSGSGSEDAEFRVTRRESLEELTSAPPQVLLPDLPPQSPSFSFRSYDWYQASGIGTERTDMDDLTRGIPSCSPARTPTKATFGATFLSNHSEISASLIPAPLSPALPPTGASHLHPQTAAHPSPTAANFRLSPIVYTVSSTQMRGSLQSVKTTATKQSHMSRSWLPDDGLYLPEEGSYDSYTMYTRRPSDSTRPTSYTPL